MIKKIPVRRIFQIDVARFNLSLEKKKSFPKITDLIRIAIRQKKYNNVYEKSTYPKSVSNFDFFKSNNVEKFVSTYGYFFRPFLQVRKITHFHHIVEQLFTKMIFFDPKKSPKKRRFFAFFSILTIFDPFFSAFFLVPNVYSPKKDA